MPDFEHKRLRQRVIEFEAGIEEAKAAAGTVDGTTGDGTTSPHTHDYAAPHDHPYADEQHDHAHFHGEYATNTDLGEHAALSHGLSEHAIDGAYHSGAEILPTQGQRNALAGTSGTPGDTNRYVTDQDARLSDAREPAAHSHPEPDLTGYVTDADMIASIEAHAAEPHGGDGGTSVHDHDADYAATGHAHDYQPSGDYAQATHDHADKADAGHAHDTSHTHTAADVGAAEAGHAHTLTDADIPAAIARDTEVTAAISAHLASATHGGGSSEHPAGSHVTPQPAIANVNRSGNASTQTSNLQSKVDEILVALRAAGVIAT